MVHIRHQFFASELLEAVFEVDGTRRSATAKCARQEDFLFVACAWNGQGKVPERIKGLRNVAAAFTNYRATELAYKCVFQDAIISFVVVIPPSVGFDFVAIFVLILGIILRCGRSQIEIRASRLHANHQ